MVLEFTCKGLLEEVIDTGEKSGERLTGAGRRGNQNISPRLNSRPSLNLDVSGLANLRVKPFGDERMKSREGHGGVIVPRHQMKLYWLGKRTDVDLLIHASRTKIRRER